MVNSLRFGTCTRRSDKKSVIPKRVWNCEITTHAGEYTTFWWKRRKKVLFLCVLNTYIYINDVGQNNKRIFVNCYFFWACDTRSNRNWFSSKCSKSWQFLRIVIVLVIWEKNPNFWFWTIKYQYSKKCIVYRSKISCKNVL